MLIGGEWAESESGRRREVLDPATLEIVGHVPEGTEEDAARAVDAAEDAFPAWSALPVRERGKMLLEAVRLTHDSLSELSTLLSREQGKPLAEARGEILGYINVLEWFQSVSGSMRGTFMDVPGSGDGIIAHEPLGVCAAIIPWNVPALTMAWKIAPALVTGNCVVLKPASATPLSNLLLASIFQDAGLPDGVLNVVTGPGEQVGEALARHPAVDKVSFTGSSAVGKRVGGIAGGNLKRVGLELGGSDPAIVCEDVDLASTAKAIVAARLYNCGQACTSLKRLYVMDSVADELQRLLVSEIEAIRVGRGLDEGVGMGPLYSASAREEVERQLAGDADNIIIGGSRPELGLPGHFLQPALIRDPSPGSPLLREEVFGPALPLTAVSDLDEALSMANDSPYGLGASIWTKDLDRARRAARELRAGRVWVNMHLRVPVEMPFGGWGDSGLGAENGLEALREHLRSKSIIVGGRP